MLFTYLRNIPRNCTTFHHPYCEYLDPSPLIPRIPLTTPILASSHPFLHTKVSTVHLKCKSHYDIYMFKLSNSSHFSFTPSNSRSPQGDLHSSVWFTFSPPLHSQLLFVTPLQTFTLGLYTFCFLCYEWTLPIQTQGTLFLPSSLCVNVTPSKKSSLNALSFSNFPTFSLSPISLFLSH